MPTATTSGRATSDDFNRADSTNLGSNWLERAGNLQLTSNTLRNVNTANDHVATWTCGNPYGNVLVAAQAQLTTSSGSVNVGARWGGYSGGIPSQGYVAELLGDGTAKLWRISDWTQLGSTYTIPSFSLSTWYTLGLRANGSQISLEINGSAVIGPVTDSAFTSGDVGVWSYAPSAAGTHRFDNWSITLLGGGQRSVKVLAKAAPRQLRAISAPPTGRAYRVYYLVNGRALAMREMSAGDTTGVLYYLHSDHLGSTSAATCGVPTGCGAAGGYQSVVSQQWYLPYGAVRHAINTMPTQRTYTGQYTEAPGLGSLMFYNARYYSSALGRFVSADTLVPEPGNPQALNRFSYVENRPVSRTDPTGHTSCAAANWDDGPQCWINGKHRNGSPSRPPLTSRPPLFDRQKGPIHPVTPWSYMTDPERLDLSQTVLTWLQSYTGPEAWWQNADGSLNAELIKAWILEGEAGELWHLPFAEREEALRLMAAILNAVIGSNLTYEILAKFTYFFNPDMSRTLDGKHKFDQKDWQRWLRKPLQVSQDYIRNNTWDPGPISYWWRENEVRRRPFEYALRFELGSGEYFYFGTEPQFIGAGIGSQ